MGFSFGAKTLDFTANLVALEPQQITPNLSPTVQTEDKRIRNSNEFSDSLLTQLAAEPSTLPPLMAFFGPPL